MLLPLLLFLVLSKINEQSRASDIAQSNTLFCPNEKRCIPIENCPNMLHLMNRNDVPIHRFRQSICGYDSTRLKICCNTDNRPDGPTYDDQDFPSSWGPRKDLRCGKSLIQSEVETLGSYPFVARIGFINTKTNDIKYSCSGAIINERTIVTTASCALARSDRYKLHSVLAGEYDSESDPDCSSLFCAHKVQCLGIAYVIKHPNYRAETYENNIALMRLRGSIDYTATAQPICLIPEDRYVSVGRTAVLVGWGKTSDQKVKPARQQPLLMKIASKQTCGDYLSQGFSIEICAIGHTEPCSGYNGSPLLYKHGDIYYLVGILSYGSNCESNAVFPAAFINLQRYMPWITENC